MHIYCMHNKHLPINVICTCFLITYRQILNMYGICHHIHHLQFSSGIILVNKYLFEIFVFGKIAFVFTYTITCQRPWTDKMFILLLQSDKYFWIRIATKTKILTMGWYFRVDTLFYLFALYINIDIISM